jgi:preprotein translocase subunit YajC
MSGNLTENIVVFILLGAVFSFVISLVIHSRRQDRKDKN